jgi:hypothetical protein
MKRYITINNNKTITLTNYVNAWKTLKAMPQEQRERTMVKESLSTWWPVTAEKCYQQYIHALHDRINKRS